jgi:tape measure domain-containing protein
MSQKVQTILEVTTKGMEAFGKVSGQLDRFQGKVTSVFHSIVNLPNIIAGTIGAGMVGSFLKADMQLEALENRIEAAVGKFTNSAEEIKYLRDEADKMGLKFIDLANSYAGFSAATTRAGISVEETRRIFRDISETAVSLKLAPERVRLVFMAMEQMASKGVVSMEELRRQLGDSFPAAMEIGAKAMNMGTQKFNELVASGQLLSAEFLPRFATQVKMELGGSFETAAKQLQANSNRISNSWFDLKQSAGEALSPIANEILKKLIDKMEEWKTSLLENKEKIISALEKIPYYFDELLDSVESFATFVYNNRDTIYFVGISIALSKAVVAINEFKIAFLALNLVMRSNPILLVASALVALGAVAQTTQGWTKKYSENKGLQEQAQLIGNLQELLSAYGQRINDAVEFNEKEILKILPNDKLDQEIENLEKNLGSFGLSFSGGLISKIDAVQAKLDELQVKLKSTSDTAKTYEQITPLTGEKKEPKPYKYQRGTLKRYKKVMEYDIEQAANNLSDYRSWGGAILNDMNKYSAKLLNAFIMKYGNAMDKVKEKTDAVKQNMADIWKRFTDNLKNEFMGMFNTLTDMNMTWAQKFQSILQQVYSMATNLLFEYLAAFITAKTTESTVGTVNSKKTDSENLSNATSGGVKLAVDSADTVAKIPYVGAALAVAMFATVIGLVAAQVNKAKGHALGTGNSSPGYFWVGEKGPELMRFRGGEKVLSHEQSIRATSGGSGGMNIKLTVNGNMDRNTADYTVKRLRKFADDYHAAIRNKYLRLGMAV